MPEPTGARLDHVHERLAALNTRLGALISEHARLLRALERPDHHPDHGPSTGEQSADGPDFIDTDPPDDALARRDRIAYTESLVRTMQRTLFVVDFTLVHGHVDPVMLRDARRALVDGLDTANALLLLDGADGAYGTDVANHYS